jgi:hypothetical protein
MTTKIQGDVLERPVASFLPPPPRGMRVRRVSIDIEYNDRGEATGASVTASYFEVAE